MNIEETINEFLAFVMDNEPEQEDLSELMLALDKLAYSMNYVNYKFDETEYPEPPEKDYQLIRKIVEKRFPTLGGYNIPQDISENIGKSKIVVGDAIDDICDIVGDLNEVIWLFNNTSTNDALWHYKNNFQYHWGKHLRELQLYLHDKN